MIFFEDKITKPTNIGITNLLSNITTREGSHKGGWARLLQCQLRHLGHTVKILDNKDSLNDFDVIVFDLGAEYSGALNLFGGLDEKVFKRLSELKDYKGRLFSWKHNLPEVGILESRRSNASTSQVFKDTPVGFLPSVSEVLRSTETFLHAYRTKGILLGDSHTPSVWTPELMIERRDGRTLQGMLEHKTIEKYVKQFELSGNKIDAIHVHCSSIDVRHHVHRQPDPDLFVVGLATQLIEQLMQVSGDAKLIVTHTMGIEDESRELPKTGYFKGTPFYGTWEQRNRSREIFNAVIDEISKIDREGENSVIKFPNYFFDEAGKLRFEVMEKPQSVHLSPEHYRWDLNNNRDRWIHEEGR